MSSYIATEHSHSAGSYGISVLIHGAIVLAILLSTYALKEATKKTADVMELVGGLGDNYMATEATRLGTPDVIDFPEIPSPPQTAPVVAPTPAPPTPVVEATPPPVVTPAPNQVVLPPSKQQTKTQPKADPVTPTPKRMSLDEFNKINPKSKSTPSNKQPTGTTKTATTVKAKQISSPTKGLPGGVVDGTSTREGAGGRALTASQQDALERYFALLAQRIKEAHEKPEGVSSALTVLVEYQVAASGTIGAVKIIRSSGSRVFDDSVLKAFRSVRPIGPRPDGKSGAKIAEFRMIEDTN